MFISPFRIPNKGTDEFFPHRLMEQSNRQLKQLVEEKDARTGRVLPADGIQCPA